MRTALLPLCAAVCAAALHAPAAAESVAADRAARAPVGALPARLPVAGGDGWRLSAFARAFDAADAVPVRDFSGSWSAYAPRAGRNAAVEVLQAEAGASRRGWEVALVGRSEIVIEGSRGAWDAVRADKQRRAPADGTRLDADAAGSGVAFVGVRGARTWRLGDVDGGAWRLTAAATLMSVRRVQTLSARGWVAFDGATYTFDAAGTRRDSWREFDGFGSPGATGSGVSTDFGLAWQLPSGRWFANLSVVDALSRLRVGGVATQELAVSSSTAVVGPDGYVTYQPLLTGRDSAQALRLSLARKTALLAGRAFDAPWGGEALAGVRVEHLPGLTLPAAWAVLPLRGGVALQLDAEARFRSIGVGLSGHRFGVFVRTRSLPVGGSHALGWQAALNWPL